MRMNTLAAAFLISGALVLGGCHTTPQSEEERANLRDESNTSLNELTREDSSLQEFMSRAVGYAIFPSVGKGGAVVGGAYGKGEVFEGNQMIGYANLSQASVGLQLGGQEYTELVVFGTREAFDKFKGNQFAFSADASAVALKSGAAAKAEFKNGVAVFTKPKGGLMFEASVAGQKFNYVPKNQAKVNQDNDMPRSTTTTERVERDTNTTK